jgi:hypothetical protein
MREQHARVCFVLQGARYIEHLTRAGGFLRYSLVLSSVGRSVPTNRAVAHANDAGRAGQSHRCGTGARQVVSVRAMDRCIGIRPPPMDHH